MRAAWSLALLAAAVTTLAGCKKHKPPSRVRVWLGPSHACSLQKSGALECWGRNDAGQLGDGTTTTRALPAPVLDAGKIDDLAIGARHTCVLANGGVRCFGEGARGQLGTGLTTLAGVTAITAGGDRSCALTPSGVRCWGDGIPDAQEPEGFHGAASHVAVGGEGFASAVRSAVGSDGFVCAAFGAPTKAVRCAGSDDRGQSAAHQPIVTGYAVVGLTAGGKHACALLDDGAVQCWGANDYGQLGDGTHTGASVPVVVHGLPPAVEIRAGKAHTCARLRNNTIACWGDNRAHQLVNGTSEPSSTPSPVPGLVGVQELALGGDSGCARLFDDGAVRCWGANGFGQLGDGTTLPHDVPMPVKAGVVAPRQPD